MKYKTRGNSNPKGKPKVYFCCHSKDFNKYFKSISDEILNKQNCAIWYTDTVVEHDEDYFVALKQMQLFIMPVTTNLLCTQNEALDIEFKFAIENHIPVLPLMQEGGLEELFNKKCGDLQFLDKQNTDITAISYNEKLEKYLSSILIGDELAEKIRAAFDAYVFLSYRKKDRKYAQKIMHLIHKNEFCRDIAIWYDEFLSPGENFNDSIKDALQKSGLFVLAVTPNLVNEPNYIMTTEYPMAKQEGKPILPIELVPTDRKQLSEKYEDIPNPADAHNEAELSEALLESIKRMAIKESDNSPEHNFFIGLAYLGGVDVEVNHERALALIISSAEAGVPEAMKKLAFMYKNGEGTSKNYQNVLKWNQKVLDYYIQTYGLKDLHTAAAIEDLAYTYFEMENLDKSLELQEQAFAIRNEIQKETHPDYISSLANLGKLNSIIGARIVEIRDKFSTSFCFCDEKKIRRSVELHEKLYNIQYKLCCGNKGDALVAMCELAVARSEWLYYGGKNISVGDSISVKELCQDAYEYLYSDNDLNGYQTLDSFNLLTYAFEYIGDYVNMLKVSQKSVEYSKKTFGDKDTLTLNALKRDALCLIVAGNRIKSELYNNGEDLVCDEFLLASKILEKLYKNIKDKVGTNSIETIEILSSLAYAHYLCSEYEKEFDCYFKIYEIQCKLFGEYNQSTLETLKIMNNTVYSFSDDYKKRLWLKNKLYETLCVVEGATSVNCLYALIELAQKYDEEGDTVTATKMYDTAIREILENIKLNGMIDNLKIMGNIYVDKGDYKKSLMVHKKLCELYEGNIKYKLKFMSRLALDYKNLGQREKAMGLCEKIYQNEKYLSKEIVDVLDEIKLYYLLEDVLNKL